MRITLELISLQDLCAMWGNYVSIMLYWTNKSATAQSRSVQSVISTEPFDSLPWSSDGSGNIVQLNLNFGRCWICTPVLPTHTPINGGRGGGQLCSTCVDTVFTFRGATSQMHLERVNVDYTAGAIIYRMYESNVQLVYLYRSRLREIIFY